MADRRSKDGDVSHLPAEVREWLSQLEVLNRSEDVPKRLALLQRVLKRISPLDASFLWAELQATLGSAYEELPMGGRDRRRQLKRAIGCYDAALTVYSSEGAPAEWAKTHLNKGNALCELAGLLGRARQARMLRAAITCYDAALTVYTCEAAPTDWASVQNRKGIALCHLAELLGGVKRAKILSEAVLCYDAALLAYRGEVTPVDWAIVHNNKGNALCDLAELLVGQERMETLRRALVYYDTALQALSREEMAHDWAMIQNNKGNVLRNLAQVLGGTERAETLRQALACYDAALTVYTREETPLDWALAQNNKGNALHDLVGLLDNTEQVEQLYNVLACYDAALTVHTHDQMPADWAMVQNNKGVVLRDLAGTLKGVERTTLLRQAIACYDKALLERRREVVPIEWAMTQNNKGNVLRDLVGLLEGVQRAKILRQAIACYDKALLEYLPEEMPADWAMAQNNKAAALLDLAGLVEGKRRAQVVGQAIACCDTALTVYTREETPADWALAKNNKGIALRVLAGALEDPDQKELLFQALAYFDDALLERRREVAPLEWAATQNNKGNALDDVAKLLTGRESRDKLCQAITCYDQSLLEWSREVTPTEWAMTQHNKGGTLANLAKLLGGTERAETLRQALTCYDAALALYARDEAPLHWAMIQQNKGTVLSDLAETLQGGERMETLKAALACYDAGLSTSDLGRPPVHWAMTQNNKGIALSRLAESLEGTERVQALHQALDCYDAALTVSTREASPLYWAATQDNKGNALSELAQLLEETARQQTLRAAILCHDAALTVYSSQATPIDWAIAQTNKGNVLRDLAELLESGKEETLQEALACYELTLTVYTREVLPVDHHRVTQAVGLLLFEQGKWESAARYLALALDALDDLFTMEVTAWGRQTTLTVGGELTAHLAYALIRTGRGDAAWQAAEALERGRARATGEAMARQQAQLAAAEQLTPDLLRAFREASDRLASMAFVRDPFSTSLERREVFSATETANALERLGRRALQMQLAGYEEAREARNTYDAIVKRIRETIPDFLRQGGVLEAAIEALAHDERFVSIASTPVGAVAVLIGSFKNNDGISLVEQWWDERLTSKEIARLLVGSREEERSQQGASKGLLTAPFHQGRLHEALRVAMQTLGVAGGVLAHLTTYCRTTGIRRLVLVPCGLLGLLPLHAALVPAASMEEFEPLLDVVQVNYAASARIWATCRRRASGSLVETINALLVGDPQPQDPEVRPLRRAKDEIKVIREMITQQTSGQLSAFEGIQATLFNVLDALKTRGTRLTHIHFACHGLAHLTDPHTSGLLLAYGARLMTRDLLDPTLVRFDRLRLAVLSACQTALPGTELPDEVVGLPSGWLQAGAMGVVASLWPVSDSKTVALMTKFYELHLLDRCDPPEALWLAQRWFRQLPTWRQDCQAAGALRAAQGPAVNEVVRTLAGARSEMGLLDDEALVVTETGRETAEPDGDQLRASDVVEGHSAYTVPPPTQQQTFWEQARHWAAFVIYGV